MLVVLIPHFATIGINMASQSELERYQADPVVNGLQLARDHGSVPEIYHNKVILSLAAKSYHQPRRKANM